MEREITVEAIFDFTKEMIPSNSQKETKRVKIYIYNKRKEVEKKRKRPKEKMLKEKTLMYLKCLKYLLIT